MSWAEDNLYDGYWPEIGTDPLAFRKYEWTQKNGEPIRLKQMTDRHLYHAYCKCTDEEVRELMMKEMTFRMFEVRVKNER